MLTIRSACKGNAAKDFHFVPHELWQIHKNGQKEQIIIKIFNSSAILKEDAKIQAMECLKGKEDIEYTAFPICTYSDTTKFMNLGKAHL